MSSKRPLASLALGLALLAAPAPAPAIYRGTAAPPGVAPSAVALVTAGEPAHASHFCGGTLVAADLVLTAAHCVAETEPGAVEVISGRRRLGDEGAGERTRVAAFLRAPRVDGAAPDAVLLRLTRAVAAPAMAVPDGADAGADRPGRRATVVGWGVTSGRLVGSTDELRSARLTIRSSAACRAAYRGDFAPASELCAGDGAPDSCSGDSGGPLLGRTADGRELLLGVTSYGAGPCGAGTEPGSYVRVRALSAWLRRQGARVEPFGGGAAAEPAAGVRLRLRFGRIACPGAVCRVEVRGSAGPGSERVRIRVTARRGASGRRSAVRRVATARRVAPGRWVARLDLPVGRVTLSAQPQLGGRAAGPTVRLPLVVS